MTAMQNHDCRARALHVHKLLGIEEDLERQEQLSLVWAEDLSLLDENSIQQIFPNDFSRSSRGTILAQKRLSSISTYMKHHTTEFDEHVTMSDILRINQQDADREGKRGMFVCVAVVATVGGICYDPHLGLLIFTIFSLIAWFNEQNRKKAKGKTKSLIK